MNSSVGVSLQAGIPLSLTSYNLNLARLHELVSDGKNWCFTMELVEGIDFLSYVRSGAEEHSPPVGEEGLDLTLTDRLREACRQLAEGVAAMHEAGRAHRDLKPPNVLVTNSGRVVILDFGLATELVPEGMRDARDVLGTVAYIAPEQAAGLPASPAADWYSVGVMLYEALTGRLPFPGRPSEILKNKQRFEPPPAHELDHHVPQDLDSLCAELLRRDPESCAPSGVEVLRRPGCACNCRREVSAGI